MKVKPVRNFDMMHKKADLYDWS